MAELERKQLISDEALEAPVVLAANLAKVVAELDKIVKSGKGIDASLSGAKSFKDVRIESEKLSVAQKELSAQTKAIEKAQARLNPEYQKGQKELIALRTAQQASTQKMREQARETSGLTSLYQKQSAKLNRLRKEYKDLELQNKGNTKEAKSLLKEITVLDNKLKRVDDIVGQNTRSVGKYTNVWKGFGNILSAAGVLGGLTGIVMVLKDAFNTIREFDKEMTNMGSVAGMTRKELEGVEKEIRRVAATSINTANEVAKTATALFTLGQTKEQIESLLAPVNSLSIALQAPAEEAGELLIQTLNAFGKSSESAEEYADVIAKMASATALDFERTRDALGYIAPVAKAVGLTLEETGAIIGVLVDNGIQASRAGRLMSSSFARLNQQGLTLDEALNKINTSTDKTATATKLFGTESFALALILADNIDKTAEYTAALEDAGGSLKGLTDKQLESMDAKIKILGSTWEEFILSMENGEGVISRVFIGAIEMVTDFVAGLTSINKSIEEIERNAIDNILTQNAKQEVNQLKKDFERAKELGSDVTIEAFTQSVINQQKESLRLFKETYAERLKREIELQKLLQKGTITEAQYEELKGLKSINESQKTQFELRKGSIAVLEDYLNKLKSETGAVNEDTEAINKNNSALDEALRKRKETNTVSNIGELPDIGGLPGEETFEEDINNRMNILKNHLEEVESAEEKSYQQRLEDLKQFQKERLQEVGENFVQASIDLYNARVEGRIQALELENEEFQSNKEKELEFDEGNEERQAAIRQQAADKEEATRKRINSLRRKQAIADKALAITSTVINTFQAIAAALAPPPVGLGPVAGIPLSVAVGALGAVQVAGIIAQPIPQFAKGTDYSPEGPAWINEQGPELMETKDGRKHIVNSDGPTLTYLQKGTKIHTAKETQDILSRSAIDGIRFVAPNDRRTNNNKDVVDGLKEVKRAITRSKAGSVSVYSDDRLMKIVREDYA